MMSPSDKKKVEDYLALLEKQRKETDDPVAKLIIDMITNMHTPEEILQALNDDPSLLTA